jgi:glycolate oxidase iron-sulfur subunit
LPNTDLILQLTDRCVMCGLCLPHCPTYRLLRSEADSPRGRIALIQALAKNQLEASPSLQLHLDRCLVCRACERMCPSKVEYGRLINTCRNQLQAKKPKRLKLMLESVVDIGKLQRSASALRTYQRSGLQWLARKSGILKGLDVEALEGLLPELPDAFELQTYYPATTTARGDVGLFVGCIGSLLEGEIHLATIRLLNHLGFNVHVPKQQGCCGSLHQHSGEHDTAGQLAEANRHAFAGLKLNAIVSTASGCAAQLFEYAEVFADALPAPLYEICDFLLQQWPHDSLPLNPLARRVALHLPCTQRNVLRRPDAAQHLLEKIPQLQLQTLAENDQCCGAAGSYMLTQPEIAARLREQKLDALANMDTNILVSNNLGCALHIAGGMETRGMKIEIVHPVLLLDESLEGSR